MWNDGVGVRISMAGNAKFHVDLAISPSFAKAESDWVAQTGEPPCLMTSAV